jgi:acetyltransferase-like isoleucine patch superfamily enzyme
MELQYVDGRSFGLDKTVKIHATANLIGDIEIGPNTRIDGGVTITGNVKIGRNCHISTGACLYGSAGIIVGDDCGISAGCCIFSGTDDPDIGLLALHAENDRKRAAREGTVRIGNRVVIGANCVFYPGVTVGDEVMVGALSFVNMNLEPGWIYAGVPARGLRPRPPLRYGK